MQIEVVAPEGLADTREAEVDALLREAYPAQAGPRRTILTTGDDGDIVGHLSAYVRTIRIDGREVSIGLIGDVATRIAARGRGVAKGMVARAHDLFRKEDIRFAMLFAFDPPVYASSGYHAITAPMTYLNGAGTPRTRVLPGAMVCALTDMPWPNGEIDLCGPPV